MCQLHLVFMPFSLHRMRKMEQHAICMLLPRNVSLQTLTLKHYTKFCRAKITLICVNSVCYNLYIAGS
jgi:hypothetical protein